jgi:hypothetical protein
MRPAQERAAMRQAGLVPIPFEIQPGSGCPGGVVEKGPRAGKPLPMCTTCNRLGGKELEPAVTITRGFVECCNFLALGGHPGMVAGIDGGAQAVDLGMGQRTAPIGGPEA